MAHGFLNGSKYNEETSSIAAIIERSITELKIPEGTTKIGNYAFSYCTSLKKIYIPEGVTSIGANALNATSLTELVLPLSCETISTYSIYNNQKLKSIIFGDIKKIGDHGIGSVQSCMIFDFSRCTTVPTLTNAFDVNAKGKIYVPAELYSEWIEATNWSSLAEYIVPVCDVPKITVPDYVSEGLEYSEPSSYDTVKVIGRGSCTDSVVVLPETYNGYRVEGVSGNAFTDDVLLDTLIFPEHGGIIDDYEALGGSHVKKIKNLRGGVSFALDGLSLEVISFTGNCYDFSGLDLYGIVGSPIYDYTASKSIPVILGEVDYISVGENTRIIVPVELYKEWKDDTNWSQYAEYIVAAK